jgi:bifunctional non-homologous end joining protein LigD
MGLTEYRKKRDFKVTREPAGKEAASRERRIFVVQHHFASSEHYDFRLELDGVLKSWAVPKGPSVKPGERRLAVEVEDHPLEYATFTGRIPEGQYGAGKVERWDMGTWETEADAAKALKRGSLEFVLKGKRLKGGWRLVRMKDDDGNAKKHNWLLIKRTATPTKTPAHAATKKG